MPYSIVIADDDRTICKGLSMIIEQKCPNLKLDGVFFNGDDLFSYLEKKNVDIILSDIVMQGKTGIDIAEHVKKISPNTFVVLITGHYVFDFAKRAIDSKVDYFITKPYTTDYLLEKLDEICKRIDENISNAISSSDLYIKNWQYNYQLLRQFYQGSVSPNEVSTISLCANTKEIKNLSCAQITLHFNPLENKKIDSDTIDATIKEACTFDSYTLSAIPVRESYPDYSVIALFEKEDDLFSFINDAKKTLRDSLPLTISFNIDFYSDFLALYDFERTNKLSSDYSTLILQNNHSQIKELFNIFSTFNKTQLYNIAAQTTENLKKYFVEISPALPDENDEKSLLDFLFSLPLLIENSSAQIPFIKRFEEFVEQNYMKDYLTLSFIANNLHISTNYLGKIVKSHFGISYTDYISKKRIEAAKHLLKNTADPIANISNEVGYPNEKYFRRVFSKIVGCSPRDYRKRP